jgi:hypothetical protein
MGVVPIDCGCHPGTTACQSRGIHDRSALRSLFMLEGARSMRVVGIQPKVWRPSWPPIAHRNVGESNPFRLGVENQSLRSSRSRPAVSVENR